MAVSQSSARVDALLEQGDWTQIKSTSSHNAYLVKHQALGKYNVTVTHGDDFEVVVSKPRIFSNYTDEDTESIKRNLLQRSQLKNFIRNRLAQTKNAIASAASSVVITPSTESVVRKKSQQDTLDNSSASSSSGASERSKKLPFKKVNWCIPVSAETAFNEKVSSVIKELKNRGKIDSNVRDDEIEKTLMANDDLIRLLVENGTTAFDTVVISLEPLLKQADSKPCVSAPKVVKNVSKGSSKSIADEATLLFKKHYYWKIKKEDYQDIDIESMRTFFERNPKVAEGFIKGWSPFESDTTLNSIIDKKRKEKIKQPIYESPLPVSPSPSPVLIPSAISTPSTIPPDSNSESVTEDKKVTDVSDEMQQAIKKIRTLGAPFDHVDADILINILKKQTAVLTHITEGKSLEAVKIILQFRLPKEMRS